MYNLHPEVEDQTSGVRLSHKVYLIISHDSHDHPMLHPPLYPSHSGIYSGLCLSRALSHAAVFVRIGVKMII